VKKLLVCCAALAGCATNTPAPVAEMNAARAMVSQAHPAASQYAPNELRAAQMKLERAEAAMARDKHTEARILAEQAEVDAKLAWTIADAERAKQELAGVNK
jgi:hypothetical protein